MMPALDQFEDIKILEEKLKSNVLPKELYQKANISIERLVRLTSSSSYSQEYDQVSRYLDWITALPWNKRSEEVSSIDYAKKILDANHHGLENVKERILEYISVVSLKKNQQQQTNSSSLQSGTKGTDNIKAPALFLVGLVGTGKTTLAYSIAQALNRQIGRIPLGGMGDALQLRGKSRMHSDSDPGLIMKVLRRTGVINPVILLDEVDRVADEARADIMGILVEILDPEQNSRFLDYYIDYPFDLSEVLFIATANNTRGVAQAVLDRLETIELPTYSDQQKIVIGRDYLLPRALAGSGLKPSDLTFDVSVWPQIVRPLGFDAGTRTLDRTINAICRKGAKLKIEKKISKLTLKQNNIKDF